MTDEQIERVQHLIDYVASETGIEWEPADKALASLQQELEELRAENEVLHRESDADLDAIARRLNASMAQDLAHFRRIEEAAVYIIDPNTSPFATQQEAIYNLEATLRSALDPQEVKG